LRLLFFITAVVLVWLAFSKKGAGQSSAVVNYQGSAGANELDDANANIGVGAPQGTSTLEDYARAALQTYLPGGEVVGMSDADFLNYLEYAPGIPVAIKGPRNDDGGS